MIQAHLLWWIHTYLIIFDSSTLKLSSFSWKFTWNFAKNYETKVVYMRVCLPFLTARPTDDSRNDSRNRNRKQLSIGIVSFSSWSNGGAMANFNKNVLIFPCFVIFGARIEQKDGYLQKGTPFADERSEVWSVIEWNITNSTKSGWLKLCTIILFYAETMNFPNLKTASSSNVETMKTKKQRKQDHKKPLRRNTVPSKFCPNYAVTPYYCHCTAAIRELFYLWD